MILHYQYYKGIRLGLICRRYGNRKAKQFTLIDPGLNVWIPNKHLDKAGYIKPNENIDYVFRNKKNLLKRAGYGMETIIRFY